MKKKKFKVLPCPCCGSTLIHVGPESALSDSVCCRDCGLRTIVTLDWLQSQIERIDILEDDKLREACQREAVRRWNVRKGEERRLAGSLTETASMISDVVNDIRWGIAHNDDTGDQTVVKAADRLDAYGQTLRVLAGNDDVRKSHYKPIKGTGIAVRTK
jgi:hypothetical protein